MARLLLDTNILIDIMRGYEPTIQRAKQLEQSFELVSSTVTYLEIVAGCRDKRSLATATSFVERFPVLPIDTKASATAIALMKKYNLSHGLLQADALIAAIALTNSLPFYTRNQKDFRFIEALSFIG
ncbi:MAG: PIN domain-containing protein [Cyanobacteria bacterium J06626_6]